MFFSLNKIFMLFTKIYVISKNIQMFIKNKIDFKILNIKLIKKFFTNLTNYWGNKC